MKSDTDLTVSVTTRGDVAEEAKRYATDRVGRLIGSIATPVLFAEVRLVEEPDPARDRPSLAEVTLDLNGTPVRAHVAAHHMMEAIDLLEDRLRQRLGRYTSRRSDRRRAKEASTPVDDHEWRHGDLPAQRPGYFDRPVDERQLVRRKSFAVAEMTPDEAADALDLLGHDFFLFRNLVTGADAVISWDGVNDLELVDASERADAVGADTVGPIGVGASLPPHCSVAEAIERLDLDLEPFVFFVDAESNRGNVVYRRYDGHYGLITPD